MTEIISLLLTISGVCGAIVTIIGCATLLAKKPKKWIQNLIRETELDSQKEIKNLLKNIDAKIADNKDGTLASLRHSITDIYETYEEEQAMPLHIKKDLCSLYENYIKLGGNSYIVELFDIMHNWKIK